jgi:Ca-activated chloride channel homolog
MKRVLFAALCGVVLFALDGGASRGQVFRSEADAVNVDVLVTDGNRPVLGLTADDFELRDNGVVQRVTSSSLADVPLAVLLALDTSSSVEGGTLGNLKAGAESALRLLKPQDRAALLAFANSIGLVAPWGASQGQLLAAIGAAKAGGTTSLQDAAFSAMTLRHDATGYRNLVILFSDGADTSSWLPASAVLDKARRADSVVYSVLFSSRGIPPPDGKLHYRSGIELSPPQVRSERASTPFAQELAEITGGDLFGPRSASELRDLFSRILTEFRTRYLLTYTPQGVNTPGWHSIDVKLKTRQGRVRARRGYSR